ncbi:MAG: tRNA glutamyl-Q(34) synthetase GluQRS [Rhizomicrobium sp.]
MIVTRFAPSPTGYLHLGHAYAARCAAGAGDRFLLRIEDLDMSRAREDFVAAIFEDLAWLGLSWERPVLRQSRRSAAYRAALEKLESFSYPCFCTRKEIAEDVAGAALAPHPPLPGDPEARLYPGTCRSLCAAERARRIEEGAPYALRLDWAKAADHVGVLTFSEHGRTVEVQPSRLGDLVLARKDLPASYHLAVVVDDAAQGVNLVTRGEDLLPTTHAQRLIQALLGYSPPSYAHHPLLLDGKGRKFSKRDQSPTLRSLRATGASPAGLEELFQRYLRPAG